MSERDGASHELAPLSDNLDLDLERQTPSASPLPRQSERQQRQKQHPPSTAFLDGLRGLAAFVVYLHHTIGNFDRTVLAHGFGEGGHWYVGSLPFVRILFNGGNAAVALFFVLSGYVLGRSPMRRLLLARNDGNGIGNGKRDAACLWALASAVVRRPLRLYVPPLVLTFVFALMLHVPGNFVPQLLWPQPKEDVFLEAMNWVVESVRFFNPFQSHSNEWFFAYNIVVWTIPVELKGSMLIYGLAALYALNPTRLSARAYVLVCSAAAVALLQTGFWSMACFIAGLVLTCVDVYAPLDVVPSFLSRRWGSPRTRAVAHHLAFVAGYYLLCQPAHSGTPEYSLDTPGWRTLTRLVPGVYSENQYYRYWPSWGAALLLYAVLRIAWLQRFFNTRPLQYLGRVSFMFYLAHLPMQYILGDRVARMFGHVAEGAQPSWWDNRLAVPDVGPLGFNSRFLLMTAVMLPVNMLVADFLTKVLDVPCVRLGKRLTRWLGLEQRAAARKAGNSG
ncbi:hypothetical protein VTK26DRAFT_280 [Humicola hyalothermophila]